MEDGVVTPIMANFPEGTVADVKINGDTHVKEEKENNVEESSSESDALVIDESVAKPKIKKKRVSKVKAAENEVIAHSNPYFNESLFELITQDCNKVSKSKKKTKPKLREYAQYLGLQPTVQFKCSKCGLAGFESLSSLNDHVVQCNEVRNIQQTPSENPCSGFKLTRKVFLCSACGTYYENWNLYMHMLEFHRRYICLYCLGMFSMLQDLCQHIQSKHNLEPGFKNSPDEFFNTYNEPCYLVCCECNKHFTEQDNFFYHNCDVSKGKTKTVAAKPTLIAPGNHITGESGSVNIDKTLATTSTTQQQDSTTAGAESELPVTGSVSEEKLENESDVSKETNDLSAKVTVNNQEPDLQVTNSTPEMTEESKNNDNVDENNETNSPDLSRENVDEDEKIEVDDKSEEEVDVEEDDEEEMAESPEPVETRKVPKLSLKLPKPGTYPEIVNNDEDDEYSNDSDRLAMELDQIESENENPDVEETEEAAPEATVTEEDEPAAAPADEAPEAEAANDDGDKPEEADDATSSIQVAGSEVGIIELELEQPLDKFDIRLLLQKCLKATVSTCIYCNHARVIAVNGKQLGLHAIAEHRFSAVVNSITAEELIPESFVTRIRECLPELEAVFFNLESDVSAEAVTFSHSFECFQCHFSTSVHKELYLHNRKLHAKNLLLCIMCKSNFFSYSELICHLCPGVYVLDYDLQFRCCLCVSDDLPSAFRLMVHLRKRHHVCDVCLEMCHNQYRLSNHVWKHKLHHFCYRCGIAYRNKPDITRHLFWKHGTESVLCKKCLQKKWPHVYHFCVPPAFFTCEECSLTFSKAVALKVHKRLHADVKPHACTFEDCTEKFISKKLVRKHEDRHRAPPEEAKEEKPETEEVAEKEEEKKVEAVEEKVEEKPKPKIDVYDLPALNLSESDSSESEAEVEKSKPITPTATEEEEKPINDETAAEIVDEIDGINVDNELVREEQVVVKGEVEEEPEKPTPIIENIWEDFKNYQANKDKLDQIFVESTVVEEIKVEEEEKKPEEMSAEAALRDHDYCIDPERKPDASIIEVKPDLTLTERMDHDYCTPKSEGEDKKEQEVEGNTRPGGRTATADKSSSDSSSDSDSSCSCGSNCSCSSSSGGSPSSSTSDSSGSDSSTAEGRRRQIERRARRKLKSKADSRKAAAAAASKTAAVSTEQAAAARPQPAAVAPIETPILESDLETTESETDEEFYDRQPHKLAKKVFEEKRNQLIAEAGSGGFVESTSRPPTPPPEEEAPPPRQKKKSKSKKRKKKKSEKRTHEIVRKQYEACGTPTVAPITLSLTPAAAYCTLTPGGGAALDSTPLNDAVRRRDSTDSSSNLRASKRRRVPNKFYGYSSDEEDKDKSANAHMQKWRKTENATTPRSPMVVPPITIKTVSTPMRAAPVTHHVPPPPAHPPIEPISISRSGGGVRIQRRMPPIRLLPPRQQTEESGTDSNDSDDEEEPEEEVARMPPPGVAPPPNQPPQLYCYCRCPYDEVSEMIGCDSSDCAIEWFHFECVGIMVPPKGQWFCPDCRKKKQMRRELLQASS
ncbi:unnamed protein product [Brassicogethes aeneus]|uniref:C2H2-type domain-containing protein n=1 Tax=Brassicogethes aeneus TaxID=1431903 RepID=A0A9P0FHN3_BRAAE|nr:unnamed protein product [Brassicogethes aeneus]